jgi:hypothetical protein
MLVSDLITLALRKLRVLAPNESPTATELSDALIALNLMLDAWTADSCFIHARSRNPFPLVSNQYVYTIGPSGADFTLTRPIRLESAGLILDNSIANPLEVPVELLLYSDEYAGIINKTLVATYPRKIWYNPTYPNGTIYLWPVPSGSNIYIVLYVAQLLSQFSATSESVAFPPGYANALVYNLAIELAEDYGVTPTENIMMLADKSKARVKADNVVKTIPLLGSDYPTRERGRFNIILGDWKQ